MFNGIFCNSNVSERNKVKNDKIAIVGLGYVGLPLALRFLEAGKQIIGLDNDTDKIRMLNAGECYIRHIDKERLQTLAGPEFSASSNYADVAHASAVILCLPTPLDEHLQPDLSFVVDTLAGVIPYLSPGQTVVLESTTYPGTTEEILKGQLEEAGFRVGVDIYLVYSPEREDPGRKDFTTANTPKLVSGVTKACLQNGLALYANVVETLVPVSSPRVAEMAKLLENIHRAVNIGLANEMKTVALAMGIDIFEVIDAAATKPFGFVAYRPGPGLGGHCIPIDPFYLTWKAREYGVNTRFIELAGEINRAMPAWVVAKIAEALNSDGRPINGSKILILGVAYKKNVDDMRETPAAEIMSLLQEQGAILGYSDPHVPKFKKMRSYNFETESIELNSDSLENQDCVVVVTDHDDFDYALVRKHAKLIVDTRGVYRDKAPNIFSA